MVDAVAMFTHNELGKRSHLISFSQRWTADGLVEHTSRLQPTGSLAVDFDHAMNGLRGIRFHHRLTSPMLTDGWQLLINPVPPAVVVINARMTEANKHTSISRGTGELAVEGAVDDDPQVHAMTRAWENSAP